MVAFATQVKRRRGTTAQNDTFTGAEGEIVVDTQKHTLRVHDGLTQGGFEIAKTEDVNELNRLILSSVAPAGIVSAFAGTTSPSGWLKCDGSAISRTTYADLFAAIGTIYGAGDGSTTFNLPNLTGACYQKSGIGVNGQYVLDNVTLPGAIYTAPTDGLLVVRIDGAYKEDYGLTVYNPDGQIYGGGWRFDDQDGYTQGTTFYIPLVNGARVEASTTKNKITMTKGRFYPFKTYPTMTQCIKY